jgi:hypothetical protein
MKRRQILTPAQAAAELNLGTTTVREWLERSILPGFRLDSRWYLKRAELIAGGWLTPAADEASPIPGASQGEAPVSPGAPLGGSDRATDSEPSPILPDG